MIRCPHCGSSDIRKFTGDWYVCRDCLSLFNEHEVIEHKTATEEFFDTICIQIGYAILMHDVNRLKMIRYLILRVVKENKYLSDKYRLKEKIKEIDEAIKRFEEVNEE